MNEWSIVPAFKRTHMEEVVAAPPTLLEYGSGG